LKLHIEWAKEKIRLGNVVQACFEGCEQAVKKSGY